MWSFLTLVMSLRLLYFKQDGSLAERSKAPASGAGPKGREFESRSCQFIPDEEILPGVANAEKTLPTGIEPVTLRLTAARSNH